MKMPASPQTAQPNLNPKWEKVLRSRLLGQPQALDSITPYVYEHMLGLSSDIRPAGVFLLLGPTGVGKTETVEALAEAICKDEKSYLRIDGGEFQHSHEIAKLLGSPAGYLGHRETPALLDRNRIEGVRGNAGLSIILFDEVEKAHHAFYNLLLGILDKGRLSLGIGQEVYFHHTLIFMTSNLGSDSIAKQGKQGFGYAPDERTADVEVEVKREVRRHFSPEFLNRVDEQITYAPLTSQTQMFLIERFVRELVVRLKEPDILCSVEDSVHDYLYKRACSVSYDLKTYGGRELGRVVVKEFRRPLVRWLIENSKVKDVIVSVKRGQLMFAEVK